MILNMLEKNGNSRLVSDPRIATLENHEAVIKFQTVIPIQTINRFTEGSSTSDIVTFQDEEIGISLRVVPRINEGGTLTLEVEPTVEDITGYVGTTNNQKPIKASRSIKTTITVNDGESVALGGLLKETEIENIERFPILGHIPLVGSFLFSSKSKEKTSTDLLILITPHIMQ
jgi:type II secretory pathway component GspD/PulD (secretin)